MQDRVLRYGGLILPVTVFIILLVSVAFGPQNVSRLIVEALASDSPAVKAGLQPGDRVVRYDNKTLASPAAFEAVQQNTFGKKDVVLEILRGGDRLGVTVPRGALGIRVRPELLPDAAKLYEQGRTSLKAGETKEAIAQWKASAKLTQEADQAAGAWLYGRAGETLESQGQWKEASEAHLAAWELLKRSSDRAAQSQTLSALGWCMANQNDFIAAAKWYEQALQVDLAAENDLWIADDFNNLGNVAGQRGDLAAAQDYFRRALAVYERLAPNSLEIAASLDNLSNVASSRGDLAAAQAYHSRALVVFERLAPNSLDVAKCLINLGIVALDRGDLAAARDYYSRSLAIGERLAPNSLQLAATLDNLGNVAYSRGDLAAAQDYYGRALAISERLAPNSLDVAKCLINLGNVHRDLAAARDYYSRALAIFERLAPDSLSVAIGLNNLGDVAYSRGDLAAAQDYFRRALAIFERLAPNSLHVAASLHSLGCVSGQRGDLQATQDYFNRALHIQERLAPDSLALAKTLTNLGEMAFKERHFPDARSLFARAATILESQRGRIPSAEARAFLVAEHGSAYEGLVQVSLALDDVPGAFLASERARARSLLDLLTEARVDIRQGIEPALLERERHLQESLNAKADRQTRLLSGKHTEKEAAAFVKEIEVLTVEYHEVQATIRTSSPHYAALTQPQPQRLEEIQRQVLDKDSLLLEYSLGEDASSLFAVSHDSIKSYQLPKRAEIDALARQLYELLTARNQHKASESVAQRNARVLQAEADYPKVAARLSQRILGPAAAQLGTKRLLIVAEGSLLPIPFAVLADPAASSPQPLLVAHEIVSLPSASVLAIQRRELSSRKPAARQLAIFADPVFEQDDERVKPIASTRSRQDEKVTAEKASSKPARDAFLPEHDFARAIGEAAIGDDRAKIQRLPFSREEANRIFSYTRQEGVLKALDFDANKKKATGDELSQYRMVHFATHALLNNDHPELSGVVLSLVDRQGKGIDGFLRLNEIYNLHLPADLVVLSACQTGLGRQIQGEGLIGLTRGFLYAGAERVVASLWKVDDEATAELMGRFYEKMLKEGQPAPAALRQAQIEMSRQKRWSGAYFWAGFEIQGEWK